MGVKVKLYLGKSQALNSCTYQNKPNKVIKKLMALD